MTIVPRKQDLIFIVKQDGGLVVDRRRAPLPTGFIPPDGTQFVMGSSDFDLGVVPNEFVWNGDEPPTFSPAPEAPPIDPNLSQVDRLNALTATMQAALGEIEQIKASITG